MWWISHAVPKWREGSDCPAFMGRPPPYCTAFCTGPPCQEMAQIHAATKNQASAWNSTNSCQITKFLTRLIIVLSLSRKNVHDHCWCPTSAVILTQGAQVASGYMPGDTLSGCCSSVSSSFFNFLCIAANWAGVDKKHSHNWCKTVELNVFLEVWRLEVLHGGLGRNILFFYKNLVFKKVSRLKITLWS